MSDYILYHATTTEEIHETSFSLLKYLELYNLKPPASHAVVIHTHKPAMLESFASYFSQFELLETEPLKAESRNSDKMAFLDQFAANHQGNFLFLGPATYPVKPLEMLFTNMARGTVYGTHYTVSKQASTTIPAEELAVLGFPGFIRKPVAELARGEDVKSVKGIIEEYRDLKEFRFLLKEFFTRYQEESIPNLVKHVHHINVKQIQEQKKQFQRLPFYTKLMRKMMGKGWKISDYAERM